jgi:glycosyltransferase involved in cell wall biosynthesis
MKIAIIKNFYEPYNIGGAEGTTKFVAESLANKNLEVVVITLHNKKKTEVEIKSDRLKIYRIYHYNFYLPYPIEKKRFFLLKIFWWILNLWNPFIFFKLKKILKKEKPDIAQVHNFYGLSHSIFSAVKSLHIPVIFFAHDFYLVCKNSSFMKKGKLCKGLCSICALFMFYNRLFVKKINKFFLLSYFSYEILKKYHKIPKDKVFIKHNACRVPVEEIQQAMEHRKNLQQKNFINFLFIGRTEKHKGIHTFLKAIEMIKSENVNFFIAGEGADKYLVEEKTKKDKRIKYFGFVQGENKKKLFLESDILVFPSECYEGSPIVIQEAYAYGLPVIASRLGSITEHIDEGKTGFLFEPGNARQLSEIIKDCINNEYKIGTMRKYCFEKALSNQINSFIENLLTFIRQ